MGRAARLDLEAHLVRVTPAPILSLADLVEIGALVDYALVAGAGVKLQTSMHRNQIHMDSCVAGEFN